MNRLTILDLNCFDISLFTISVRSNRFDRLAGEIVKKQPDVVCLQEVNFTDSLRLLTTALQKAGYTVFPNTTTHFLNPGGLVTAARVPVKHAQYIKFINQGNIFALDIFERIIARGFHVLSLALPQGKTLTVINTHLHCPFGAYESVEITKTAMDQYDQIMTDFPPASGYILAGDLNVIPLNTLYKKATTLLFDPLAKTHHVTITQKNTHRTHLPQWNGRVDYTLVSADLSPDAKAKIIFDEPVVIGGKKHHLSDHFGLLTEVLLPEGRVSKNE